MTKMDKPKRRGEASTIPLRLLSLVMLSIASAYLLGSLLLYSIQTNSQGNAFPLLKTTRTSPHFSDLNWVVVVGNCGTRGQPVDSSVLQQCTPFGYGKQGGGLPETGYPPLSNLAIKALHLPINITPTIGVIAGILMLFTLSLSSYVLFRRCHPWGLIMSAIFLSFPIQLILERGNLDSIIFLLMALSSVGIATRSKRFIVVSLFSSISAIALKIFPAAGYAGWILTAPRWKSQKTPLGALWRSFILASLLAGLDMSWQWIMNNNSSVMFEGGTNSFGLLASGYANKSLIDLLGINFARFAIWLLIIAKLASLLTGFATSIKFKIGNQLHTFFDSIENKFQQNYSVCYFLIMSWTWIGCYTTTISYDYKHIFLIPSIMASLAINSTGNHQDKGKSKWVFTAYSTMGFYVLLYPIAYYNISANQPSSMAHIIKGIGEGLGEFFLIPMMAGCLLASLLWRGKSHVIQHSNV
jgi:hypothetical protein